MPDCRRKAVHAVAMMAMAFMPLLAEAQRRPVPATIKKRVVTSSGDAEMLFASDVANTRATLAGLCEKIGWSVRWKGSMRDTLRCDVPTSETTIVQMAGANAGDLRYLIATGTAVPVRKEVVFLLAAKRGGTVVRAQAARFFPAVSGVTPVRKAIEDENTFNGLINILALAGGRFAPGTRFERIAYLGFRTDQVSDATGDGTRKTRGLVVGDVDAGSPAALAQMRVGDVIHAINGKTFGDYEGATKLMAKLRPGDPVHLTVQRDAAPITVDLVAMDVPGIR